MPLLITSKFRAHGIQEKISTKELVKYLAPTMLTKLISYYCPRGGLQILKIFKHTEEANSDSDHFLVGAKHKQRIALITRNRTENRKRWNTYKFDETDVERYYQQEVQWKLQEKLPSNDREEEWTCIKKC